MLCRRRLVLYRVLRAGYGLSAARILCNIIHGDTRSEAEHRMVCQRTASAESRCITIAIASVHSHKWLDVEVDVEAHAFAPLSPISIEQAKQTKWRKRMKYMFWIPWNNSVRLQKQECVALFAAHKGLLFLLLLLFCPARRCRWVQNDNMPRFTCPSSGGEKISKYFVRRSSWSSTVHTLHGHANEWMHDVKRNWQDNKCKYKISVAQLWRGKCAVRSLCPSFAFIFNV